jgi:hypothetical protein
LDIFDMETAPPAEDVPEKKTKKERRRSRREEEKGKANETVEKESVQSKERNKKGKGTSESVVEKVPEAQQLKGKRRGGSMPDVRPQDKKEGVRPEVPRAKKQDGRQRAGSQNEGSKPTEVKKEDSQNHQRVEPTGEAPPEKKMNKKERRLLRRRLERERGQKIATGELVESKNEGSTREEEGSKELKVVVCKEEGEEARSAQAGKQRPKIQAEAKQGQRKRQRQEEEGPREALGESQEVHPKKKQKLSTQTPRSPKVQAGPEPQQNLGRPKKNLEGIFQ